MAINYPGPYELRFKYTVDTSPGGELEHIQKFNVRLATDPDPGDAFSVIDILCADDTTRAADDVADEWGALWDDNYNSGDASLFLCELWKYAPDSFNASFVSSYAMSVAGASAVATSPASNVILTFRTTEGGIMRVSFLDTVSPPGTPLRLSDLSGGTLSLVQYIYLASNRPFLGRDTSYPFAFLGWFPGQNEGTFKQRFR